MLEMDIMGGNGEFLGRQLCTYDITGVETLDSETVFPGAVVPHIIVGFSNSPLDGTDMFVIGTTNHPDIVDDVLTRARQLRERPKSRGRMSKRKSKSPGRN